MTRNRSKITGKKVSGRFISIPMQVLNSRQYTALSAPAVKLLVDLCAQYNGTNNGDLCATWKIMKERGWRSNGTLCAAIKALLDSGFVLLARQGRRPRVASLYAISFRAIDECGGKHDLPSSPVAPNTWKDK